jgi:cell division protein FtsI (penicillin-binding protein 3)
MKRAGRFMRLRALILSALVLAAFGVVILRAAKVQLFDRSRLQRLARDQTRREIEWAPRRGLINDRRGQPLAVTQDVDSVFADPGAFATRAERETAARELARALHLDARKILRKLDGEKRFVWIQRRVDELAAARVRALGLDGVELVKEPKRFYPQRELAGHVLGFVGEEAGQEGVERELDPFLRGKTVSLPAVRDARGALVLGQGAPDAGALTGATVTLTLDSAIQLAAERELAKAVAAVHAAAGWAIVMDVNDGAVLALASSPSFDANKPGRDPAVWRNRAVQDQLEPGSTIKSFVVAAALDSGALQPDETLFCENGLWNHLGRKLHDDHPIAYATPTAVLVRSSNICAAKIGERLGKARLISYLRAFGFGEKTLVGLPGEGRGSVRDPARMPQIAVDTMSFGQGMSATGLQTVAAMAAIANGGTLLKPYLIEKVVGPDGAILLSRGREEVRRVLRPETAAQVAAMLEEVTRKGGTGTRAALADFRVAGKTGTAQKVDPVRGGYGEKRLASFLGFVPAEAPRLAILVAVDEPEGKVYGGEVAAPAWGAIASESLRQLGVVPQRSREDVFALPRPPREETELAATAAPNRIAGNFAVDPGAPPDGPARPPGAPGPRRPLGQGEVLVPDLSGLVARSAVRTLSELSLLAELRGSGTAVAQKPSAGSVVKRGARVRVVLAPPGPPGVERRP